MRLPHLTDFIGVSDVAPILNPKGSLGASDTSCWTPYPSLSIIWTSRRRIFDRIRTGIFDRMCSPCGIAIGWKRGDLVGTCVHYICMLRSGGVVMWMRPVLTPNYP